MKIALVSPRFAPFRGGVETHVSHLSRELVLLGHEVTVFTQSDGPKRAFRTSDAVKVRSFPIRIGKERYPFAPGLFGALARFGSSYDIIHAHSYHSLAPLAAAFSDRCPLVFTPHYHGTGHTNLARVLHNFYRPAGRTLLRRASQIICVSDAERSLLGNDYPEIQKKIIVIPNGIATSEFATPKNWSSRENIVLCIGRLERYKRFGLVISAISELPEDVRLVIVGSGTDRERLTSQVARLCLDRRVIFAGSLPDEDLAELLARVRVLVTASEHEAFGLVALEARQAGARVVASALDAHREVARFDHTGGIHLWAPETSTTGLVRAIRDALNSKDPGVLETVPRWPDIAATTERVYHHAFVASSATVSNVDLSREN